MAQNEEVLRGALAGIETTRGTAHAVTRRVYEQIRIMGEYEALEFAENAGTYDAWRTFVQGPVNVTGTAEGPASFEDFPWWMELGVKGGVVAVTDAGTPPAYPYLFAPSPGIDDLASATMQTGVPDNVYESVMVMVPEWTVAADIDGDAAWAFNATLLARTKDHLPGGFTAGILDHDREFIRAAGTKVYIDDLPANIGTTQVIGKAVSFSLTWNNAVEPKRFLEDVDGISARIGRGPREITGEVRLEFDTDEEYENYRLGTPRALRFEREGDIIHGAVRSRVRIDVPRAYWTTPGDDPRNTNMTLTFGFRAYFDDVSGFPASVEVVNDLPALV